jgi:flagellar hook protein FlgE
MGSALWAGISGLNASSQELDVIANNLANVNTVGFKAGTTVFADVLSQSISGGSSGTMQVGRGVQVSGVETQFGAGSFETTGNATDAAIDGDGFFMVNDKDNATFYTRAGSFHLDSGGVLVDSNGYKVQGQTVTAGVAGGPLTDINLQGVQSNPQVTTTFALGANLNSSTAAGAQYNTTQTVYDSLGAKHTLNTTFTKTENSGAGYWDIGTSLDSTPATSISTDGLIFDTDGALTGMYTGTVGTLTYGAPGSIGAVTASSGGGGTASATLDRPEMAYQTGTLKLTRDAGTGSWIFAAPADKGGYASATVTSAGTGFPIDISLDGSGTTDLHLTQTHAGWADGDTATFTLTDVPDASATATIALNRPGMVYKTGTMTLTRGATDWTISGTGGYTNAKVTSSGIVGHVTISLDGTGTTDLTLTPSAGAGDWVAGDTATFTLTNTPLPVNDITVNFSGALNGGATIGNNGDIKWNMIGNNALAITQYNTDSVTNALNANGYASGQLKTLSIDAAGRISGFFTNGQTSDLAQIVLATFTDPWGLKKMGSNLFGETVISGSSIRNNPGSSGMGSLTPNTLEMSNTDIASEFINMITAQKAYQANARVVTTQDTIMQELMNLKR